MSIENAIILAGGRGERLRPLTSDRPKPMIEVAGYPLLYHNMQWLKKAGIKTVTISCGYHHEVIREYFQDGQELGIKVIYSVEESPLGRGGGIKLAGQLLTDVKEPILVINGDTLTDLSLPDLYGYHFGSGAVATMVIVKLLSPYGIVQCDYGNYVTRFTEKPQLPYWINAGIYLISHKLLPEFPDKGDHEETLFPRLAQEHKLQAYKYTGFWKTVDTAKDLADLSKEMETAKER